MRTLLLVLLAVGAAAYDGEKVLTIAAAQGTATVDLRWNWEPPVMHTLVTVNSTSNTDLMWFAMAYNNVTDMVGADYVMGYVTPSGDVCVRPLACEQSPPPNSAPKLDISTTQFSRANGGTYQLSFTRPLASGYNPLVAGQPMSVLFAAAMANPAVAPLNCTAELTFDQAHNFFKANTTVSFSG
eukprot:TRINITY_DN297_c1_g1_i1.p2 TRINITY_DN297_c1_g1~~TRINITY_DN297_c1_g1_i1.p2  ORF type:complete len:184 (+),score=62.65 TRINITY_DN297_c1_g1_i1:49-600(+)